MEAGAFSFYYTLHNDKIWIMKVLFKNKNFWIVTYIVFLLFGVFYVRWVLKTNKVQVIKQAEEKKAVNVKPVKVYFSLYLSPDNSIPVEYHLRLQNTDTFLDFLNNLRESTNFTYEKLLHTYGIEISVVNSISPIPGYSWRVYVDGQDITNTIDKYYLKDNAHFEIKMVKSQ